VNVTPLTSSATAAPASFNAAAVRNAAPAEQRAAVAKQFEAIMVRQMLGKTMNSLLGGSTGGVASSVYGDMMTDTLSQQLTAGNGLGLSRFIQLQLTPRGEVASPAPAAPVTSTAPAAVAPAATQPSS
jgi:Rod binding domain-containing protein